RRQDRVGPWRERRGAGHPAREGIVERVLLDPLVTVADEGLLDLAQGQVLQAYARPTATGGVLQHEPTALGEDAGDLAPRDRLLVTVLGERDETGLHLHHATCPWAERARTSPSTTPTATKTGNVQAPVTSSTRLSGPWKGAQVSPTIQSRPRASTAPATAPTTGKPSQTMARN